MYDSAGVSTRALGKHPFFNFFLTKIFFSIFKRSHVLLRDSYIQCYY